jgi:hypothetical protein
MTALEILLVFVVVASVSSGTREGPRIRDGYAAPHRGPDKDAPAIPTTKTPRSAVPRAKG